MDFDDFRAMVRASGTDLWGVIDTAISVAARDHGEELRERRDGIVERLYTSGAPTERRDGIVDEEEEEEVEDGGDAAFSGPLEDRGFDLENEEDEMSKVLAIKELIEDPEQEDGILANLLQNLVDMDITFKALQETDIGRHVNALRKHPSAQVRSLVKVVVRKWKDLVDEWVKLNQNEATPSTIITEGDSPQQFQAISSQNGHHVPEFGHSPNPHTGSSGSEKNSSEAEPVQPRKKKAVTPSAAPPRREPTPTKQQQRLQASSSAPPRVREHQQQQQRKEGGGNTNLDDAERLATARKRLHENYQEAQNAKKQRTIQVMDIHDLPKPKNTYFARNNKQHQQVNRHR